MAYLYSRPLVNIGKQVLLTQMENAKQHFSYLRIFRAVYIISRNRANPFYACSDRSLGLCYPIRHRVVSYSDCCELFARKHTILKNLSKIVYSLRIHVAKMRAFNNAKTYDYNTVMEVLS